MIDLTLKIFGLVALVFVWGFVWSWAKDKEEKAIEAAHGIKGDA